MAARGVDWRSGIIAAVDRLEPCINGQKLFAWAGQGRGREEWYMQACRSWQQQQHRYTLLRERLTPQSVQGGMWCVRVCGRGPAERASLAHDGSASACRLRQAGPEIC